LGPYVLEVVSSGYLLGILAKVIPIESPGSVSHPRSLGLSRELGPPPPRRPGAGGWRDGSVVKSTGCSSGGPVFNSLQPHGSSQLSVTPVPGDPWHQVFRQNTHTYEINNFVFLSRQGFSV
jgi:hypothetical protein